MSLGYTRYAASAPRRVPAQVVRSPQSKPVARDAARTVSPAARAASATRRPERPDAPVTTTVIASAALPAAALPASAVRAADRAVSVRAVSAGAVSACVLSAGAVFVCVLSAGAVFVCVMTTSQPPGGPAAHRREARPHACASRLSSWTHSPECWRGRGPEGPS